MIEGIDPDLREELAIWRVVEGQLATLTELESTWSIDDLLRANAYLDMKTEVDTIMMNPKGIIPKGMK